MGTLCFASQRKSWILANSRNRLHKPSFKVSTNKIIFFSHNTKHFLHYVINYSVCLYFIVPCQGCVIYGHTYLLQYSKKKHKSSVVTNFKIIFMYWASIDEIKVSQNQGKSIPWSCREKRNRLIYIWNEIKKGRNCFRAIYLTVTIQ